MTIARKRSKKTEDEQRIDAVSQHIQEQFERIHQEPKVTEQDNLERLIEPPFAVSKEIADTMIRER